MDDELANGWILRVRLLPWIAEQVPTAKPMPASGSVQTILAMQVGRHCRSKDCQPPERRLPFQIVRRLNLIAQPRESGVVTENTRRLQSAPFDAFFFGSFMAQVTAVLRSTRRDLDSGRGGHC
jgi:hypothetical protein